MDKNTKWLKEIAEADRSSDYVEETLETAGCTGQCPTYPGAPVTEDGYPVCSKCPEREEFCVISSEWVNEKS